MSGVTDQAGILETLEGEGPRAAAALLPEVGGAEAIGRAADEAEGRIMADLAKALRTTGGLVELADLRGDERVRARARRVYGQALTYANQFEKALGVLEESLTLAGKAGDRVEEGRGLLTMLHAYARQTRFDEAVSCGERARDAFLAAGERVMVGRAENNLGILERMRDRPAEAIVHFERAAGALSEQPPLLAHVENNRAEALLDLDRFAEAERAFGAALEAFRAAGAARHAGIVLGNLADLTSRQGRLHEALALFEEARRVLGDAAAPGDAARLAVEQADVLLSLGMTAGAVGAYRGALPVLAQHSMAAEEARARLGLGRALARLNDDGGAAELARAAEMFATLGNASARARALAATAGLAALREEFGRALELLGQAREAVAQRPAAAAWVDLLTARTLLARGDAADAAELARRAAGTAEAVRVSPLAADLLHVRGRALRRGGKAAEAAAVLRRAVQHAERCRGTLQADVFRTAFLAERAPMWEDAASAVLDAGGEAAEAFELVEMAKSRSLLEVLAEPARPGREGASDLMAELTRVTGELNALYARAWEASEQSAAARTRISAEIARHEARSEAIVVRLGAASGVGASFASPAALGVVRAGVPARGAIVEYFAESGELSAMVLTADGVTTRRRFAALRDVSELLEAFRFQVGRAMARGMPAGERGRRLAADAEAVLGELGDAVLGPLWGEIEGRDGIVFAPAAPLHLAPFAALRVGGAALVERSEVCVVPSASVLGRLPEMARGGALAVGVADDLAPRAEQEARDVGQSLTGSVVLAGEAATRGAFVEACRGAGRVHVAGHARFIASNPGASGIKLADGWLTAAEISLLDLRGAAVVLSGCDTGRVAVAGGDEQAGLVSAVLSAGASSVTMTLWPVHDETTWLMMKNVYGRASEAGNRLGEAIRAEQLGMIGAGAHPAAWGAFQTTGAPWHS